MDTSAYLGLVLKDFSEWQGLRDATKTAFCYTSSILFVEALRNLIRHVREGHITQSEFSILYEKLKSDAEIYCIKEFSIELALTTIFPAVSLPKSLDLIHIRTALWFRETVSDIIFVTLDSSQKRAAQELGLKTAF